MLIKNGNVLTDTWQFEQLDLRIVGDTIDKTAPAGSIQAKCDLRQEPVFDAQGLYVVPGLVDIHIHACAGYDFCDAKEESVRGMSRYLIKQGVTSFVAASMAYDEERLKNVFEVGKKMVQSGIPGGAHFAEFIWKDPSFPRKKKAPSLRNILLNRILTCLTG